MKMNSINLTSVNHYSSKTNVSIASFSMDSMTLYCPDFPSTSGNIFSIFLSRFDFSRFLLYTQNDVFKTQVRTY